MLNSWKDQKYTGFEQGPIRPPSEARSLLIRVTRNCPWNRCTFCPVYKGRAFSLRPLDHVIRDIDQIHHWIKVIKEKSGGGGKLYPSDIESLVDANKSVDRSALNAALHWASSGMQSIFLQDGNSFVIKPDDLLVILHHLQKCFPWVKRVTSYGRSQTIAKIPVQKLHAMRAAGLTRIHIGMESGADSVLKKVKKGTTKSTHIKAGKMVKAANIELSEYFMPGLGGKELSEEHSLESADALNEINPDYIRLRSLAIPGHVELSRDVEAGTFQKLSDIEIVRELIVFISHLTKTTGRVRSDHSLNLFEDLEGTLPEDHGKMLKLLQSFLDLDPHEQTLFQVGRRLGLLRSISDLADNEIRSRVEQACRRFGVTVENVDRVIDDLMARFI